VKAPTLVCDDGEVLLDSTLILEYAEARACPRRLMPDTAPEVQHAVRLIGLALTACDKSVQIIYERRRPPEKLHQSWMERVTGQLLAACAALEKEVTRRAPVMTSATLTQAGITAAVAWRFTQQEMPEVVPRADFPHLVALSSQAETLAEFRAAPYV
jgi:glutathione S-transferase